MVLESILSSPRTLRSSSFRRQFTKNELGSWSTLYHRHRYLLFALTLLAILCTVYLYFAITLGEASDPCFGLNGPQKASCHVEHLKAEANERDNMASIKQMGKKKACVIGGTGFVASLLIKQLLEKGYAVNTTVRDPDNVEKTSHLVALQSLGELNIFRAELAAEEDFDAPIAGCKLVFQLATPVNFASEDPDNDMIKPTIKGVLNVLKACARAKEVERVILTSSTAAVTINLLNGTGLVMDESNWTDIEYLNTAKPPTRGYPVSKVLAEKAAWKFAEENHITVVPSLIAGPSLTPSIPSSVSLAMSLISGSDFRINALKGMQLLSGSVSITHVEDVCRAHVFLAEKESASGRYIGCAHNTSVPELVRFLNKQYTQYNIPTEFNDCPSKTKLIISTEKLVKEGFSYKYGIEEIFDQTVEYLKSKEVLKN